MFAVHSSEYLKDYGWPLDDSQWGTANIVDSSTMTVNTTDNKQYLNQQSWNTYKKTYNAGKVSAAVQPLTFSTSNEKSSNVILKWGNSEE